MVLKLKSSYSHKGNFNKFIRSSKFVYIYYEAVPKSFRYVTISKIAEYQDFIDIRYLQLDVM